jgi:hypothetical protein
MLGASIAIDALPREFWGFLILCIGAYMVEHANTATLAIIGGIITAGANMLSGKTNTQQK